MADEAETYIMSAMRKSSLVDGMFRRDIPEYPKEVFREALANAIAHRDYSSDVRGSYIQVRMFANRLEVQNPGGLFGNVTIGNQDYRRLNRVDMMTAGQDLRGLVQADLHPPPRLALPEPSYR